MGKHETRNIVCCAKHHLEIPCEICVGKDKQREEVKEKEAVKEKEEVKQ